MLHSFQSGGAVLVIVDEDYHINTLSGDVNTLRFLVGNSDLPNFAWRHNTNDPGLCTVETENGRYNGRISGGRAMEYIRQHEKKAAS